MEQLLAQINYKNSSCALFHHPGLLHLGMQTTSVGRFASNHAEDGLEMLKMALNQARDMGFQYILGPMDGSTWNHYRLVTWGEGKPFAGEPQNPIFYNHIFLEAGFEVIARYKSQKDVWPSASTQGTKELEAALRESGVKIRDIYTDNLESELYNMAIFVNKAFRDNLYFTPVEPSSFVKKYMELKPLISPEFVEIATLENEIVGLVFSFADPADPGRLILKTLARIPMDATKGLGKVLSDHVINKAAKHGFQSVIHALMQEDNRSVKLSDNHGSEIFRTYALYGKLLK
jgi:hypothetical protein